MSTIDKLLESEDEKIHAIHFLKKVFDSKNNLKLSDVQKSFDVDFVKKHIDKININDVMNIKTNNKTEDNIMKKDKLNELFLEIIPKNTIGIRTMEIVKYIMNKNNLNIEKKNMYDKIYSKLSTLEKNKYIKSYKKEKNKLFWIKL